MISLKIKPLAYFIGLALAYSFADAQAQEEIKTSSSNTANITQKSIDDVARERKQLALRSLTILDNTLERGAATANFIQDYYFWSARLVGAEIFLYTAVDLPRTMAPEVYLTSIKPASNTEILDSFRAHLKRMETLEERYRRLEQQGILSQIDYQRILDHRIEAQSWFLRESARRENLRSPQSSP